MELDKKLYHYTSADGLLGMMDGEIWSSQIQYMNDNKEWEHGFDLAWPAIKKLQASRDRKIASIADNLIMNVRPESTMSRTFVFSLTEAPDLLSQWRGYCHDGGFCVGFDKSKIESTDSFRGFKLKRCVYSDVEKNEVINSIIQKYVDKYYDIELDEVNRKKLIVESTAEFRELACYFKHSSFSEEKEWRLFGTVSVNDNRSAWRARGNLPMPFVKHKIDFFSMVDEIIVGPKVDYRLAEHSIYFKAYGHKIDIKKSRSTLV
ncbi:DUF2971 domain-containing protein [Vibrio sp. SCSIO 43086]|uniref:DUF2971 domain-containing protein n=1 Tax=Vibrio sp. SCSIO 43086 TaxID=2822845 RepID=UPI003DA86903|nr:DUF2971 domain-containing protein [Vibrio diabolicus]